MKELIESSKKLQGDIDKCISQIIEARKYRNETQLGDAYWQMESLMTATMQQLQCVIDALEHQVAYVVTEGCYSSKHIVGVFDSREKAEEYQKYSLDAEPNMIEEYGVNYMKPDKSEKLFRVYSAYDKVDFKVDPIGPEDLDMWEKDTVYISGVNRFGDRFNITFIVSADTRERAVKVAAERLAQVKAQEEIRYPLLRTKIPFSFDGRSFNKYPVYLFHTGEIVVEEHLTLLKYVVPAPQRKLLKTVTSEELRERYGLKEKEE